MNMTLLMAVAEVAGLDASQGAILHRSHRGHWEIHGRFHLTRRDGITTAQVDFLPWEGSTDVYRGRLDDTHDGIQYVPALKGVEYPDRALEIIATHLGVVVAGSVDCPDCGGSIPEHQHHGYDGPEWRCLGESDPKKAAVALVTGTT